jgi:hypothetical protein
MAAQINNITREKVISTIAKVKVSVDDVFIDGYSLQDTLKKSYKVLFSRGRFKQHFMVYLGRVLSDIYHSKKEFLQTPIPNEGETTIAPLYGCDDGCCVYLYVKVSKKGECINWEQIGRNTAFVEPSVKQENDIEWLPDFQPLIFNFTAYHSFFKI